MRIISPLIVVTLFVSFSCKEKKPKGPLEVHEIETSSELKDSKGRYSHLHLVDNDVTTSWVEGKKDDGIGETITFEMSIPFTKLEKVTIHNGYGDEKYYAKNNRVKKLKISSDAGKSFEHVLSDQSSSQTIPFPADFKGESVTLTILSVYKGSKWRDTAISEITFPGIKLSSTVVGQVTSFKALNAPDEESEEDEEGEGDEEQGGMSATFRADDFDGVTVGSLELSDDGYCSFALKSGEKVGCTYSTSDESFTVSWDSNVNAFNDAELSVDPCKSGDETTFEKVPDFAYSSDESSCIGVTLDE